MNAVHESWKSKEAKAPRFACVPCEFCDRGRQWTTYMNGAEHADICRLCAGKGTIIVEQIDATET